MRWRVQGMRGMDSYKGSVEVEAKDEDEAMARAREAGITPFADYYELTPIEDPQKEVEDD